MFCPAGEQADYVLQTYSDEYFDGGGGGYSDYLQHQDSLIAIGKGYARILARHSNAGHLLDVGSAAGFILKGFCDAGWTGTGVEPNKKMAEIARGQGLDVIQGTFEDWAPEKQFDAATIIQVISHLRDPMECLHGVNRVLRPEGLVLIETWDRSSLTARMFGKSWHQYNPPSVLHWYTKPHLQAMLEKAGFEVLDRGRPTKWISVGNGVSLIRHSVKDSKFGRIVSSPLTLVPKNLKVPYFLDDVFWVIARKHK